MSYVLILTSKKRKVMPPSLPVASAAAMTTCSLPPRTPLTRTDATLNEVVPSKVEFSSDFCRLDNALKMKNEVAQMLLPSAVDIFSGLSNVDMLSTSSTLAFKVLQANLAAAKRMQALEDDLLSSQRAEEEAKRKLSELVQVKFSLEERTSSLTLIIGNLKEEIKERSARIRSLEEYGRRKSQKVIDAAGFYTWQTKKNIMASFLAGEMNQRTPNEDIAIWEKHFEGVEPPTCDDGFDLGVCDTEAESGRTVNP
ncbi:unnamed protein product [Cuscuta europaea]|uniref:Uncharacterized protein n=1 Tax=Cuscuta europaea TaxID=41803 RepID=A0A9P1EE14_CUSEU|nr:unnamed protein product [Cuscuta europaea]